MLHMSMSWNKIITNRIWDLGIYFFNFWTRYLNNLAHKGGLVDQTLVFLNKTKSFKNLIIIQHSEHLYAYNEKRQQLN